MITLVQCPISKLREAQIDPAVPDTAPQAAATAWQNVLRALLALYRTQAPTGAVLVGTVTAAKCKMEMAPERMAPAAPSERLRSQNICPRHTVHGSSHPLLPTAAGY